MAAFSISTGLSSGIDYQALITGMLAVEKQPMTQLQTKQSNYQTRLRLYGQLADKVTALQTAANTLKLTTGFSSNKLTVGDTNVLDATSTSAATAGSYKFAVSKLAQEEKEVHAGVASSTTAVNTSGADKVFQYTYAGTQRSLTVKDATTLAGLRDQINGDTSNPGVTASIVNDGTNSRLVITGSEKGDTKSITIDAGTTLDGTGGTSDFTASSFTQTSMAQSARFTVDGVNIKRDTNTITDVIDGVTFTLKKADETTPPTTTIEIKTDNTTAKANAQKLVDAVNDLRTFVKTNSDYDPADKSAGALFGEATSRDLVSRLQTILSSSISSLPEDMRALSQIGISSDKTGATLSIDATKFDKAFSTDSKRAIEMFTAVATKIADFTKSASDAQYGSITNRKKGLQSNIDKASSQLLNMQSRLDQLQASYTTQFNNLEAMLSNMKAQSSYVSSAIASW